MWHRLCNVRDIWSSSMLLHPIKQYITHEHDCMCRPAHCHFLRHSAMHCRPHSDGMQGRLDPTYLTYPLVPPEVQLP